MRRLLLVPALLALTSACATFSSVGTDYFEEGQTEIAALYFASAYLQDTRSEEAKAQLVKAIRLASRQLDAAYDKATDARDYNAAFGVALRSEELLLWAENLQLEGFSSTSAQAQLEQARQKAIRQTLLKVDQAESEGAPKKTMLKYLRESLALSPDNTELNDRYHRLQAKLRHHIYLDPYCSYQDPQVCRAIIQRIAQKLTETRHELIVIVPANSDQLNARLRISVDVDQSDTGWNRIRSGKTTAKITRYNKFKEAEKTSDGKRKTTTVKASYSTHRRQTQSTVRLKARLQDLRPPKPLLYQGDQKQTQSDLARYYDWSGDERALTSVPLVTSLGTRQAPPASPRSLARKAWIIAADAIAQEIITQLEAS